jgi:hypothetical protein
MKIEQKLLDEVYLKREEQWKRCQVYLKQFAGIKKDCNIFNTDYCPCRCDYSMEKLRLK